MAESKQRDQNGSKRSADGAVDEAKGRVKKAVGALMGDRELEREGDLDRAAADVKRAVGGVVDKIREGASELLSDDDEKDKD